MKFAPTLAGPYYVTVDKGDYHLLQAQSVLECGQLAHWAYERSASPSHTVILDNGAAELGQGDASALFQAALQIHPDEIVVPDKINDSQWTIDACKELLQDCLECAKRVMLVPQGEDILEWVSCCDELLFIASTHHVFPVIGVTKFLEPRRERPLALAWVTQRMQEKRCITAIHCLGCHDSFNELLRYARLYPTVRGCDTTWPWALALRGTLAVTPLLRKRNVSSGDWHPSEFIDPMFLLRTEVNIAQCRQWLWEAEHGYDTPEARGSALPAMPSS